MRALLFLLSVSFCCAQSVTVGVKGGIRATNAVYGQLADESKRYIVGPAVEFGLPHKLSLEIDALYLRHGYRRGIGFLNIITTFERERANSWEFPLLVKRGLSLGRQRLFVGAGHSAQSIRGTIDALQENLFPPPAVMRFSQYQFPTAWKFSHGFVTSAGLKFTRGHIELSPEFRYTRWINPAIAFYGNRGSNILSNQNQVDFMFGIAWKNR